MLTQNQLLDKLDDIAVKVHDDYQRGANYSVYLKGIFSILFLLVSTYIRKMK